MNKTHISLLVGITWIANVRAGEPEFKSKLFKTATLVYSDDFEDDSFKGRYGHHRARKKVEDGKLVIYPPGPERGYVLVTLYRMPDKFVCHFRFQRISKPPDVANEWIDIVIEYEEWKMLLKINGSETIYEDGMVSMDGSNLIDFKSFSSESLQFNYVRLWKVIE